jgi:hypothetical protein
MSKYKNPIPITGRLSVKLPEGQFLGATVPRSSVAPTVGLDFGNLELRVLASLNDDARRAIIYNANKGDQDE